MIPANSADAILKYFSQKTGSDISCTLSPKETICKKHQNLFSGKIRKNISKCRLMKFSTQHAKHSGKLAHFQGRQFCQNYFCSLLKMSVCSKRKEYVPFLEKIISFLSMQKELDVKERKQEMLFPLYKMTENLLKQGFPWLTFWQFLPPKSCSGPFKVSSQESWVMHT